MPRYYIFLLCLSMVCLSCSKSDNLKNEFISDANEFIRGVDMSFLPQMEENGVLYRDGNNNLDALQICKNNGVNTIRLRIWHSPTNNHSSLHEVKLLSSRIKALGLKVWLTVHYSDTWADPGKQDIPAVWKSLNFENLTDSVYHYTTEIMQEIKPDYIQIGNEINLGFLHPYGDGYNHKEQFISLLAKGIQAVRDHNSNTQIMLHYAGINKASSFFTDLTALDYDIIALSYYPIWHGKDLDQLATTLTNLNSQFGKKVLIAETAYPFTLEWNDWTNNIIGSNDQLIPEYLANPQGQKDFLLAIRKACKDNQTLGFCYWGAEWIAFDGPESKNGSSWENQALFDFNNTALPAFRAFNDEE